MENTATSQLCHEEAVNLPNNVESTLVENKTADRFPVGI